MLQDFYAIFGGAGALSVAIGACVLKWAKQYSWKISCSRQKSIEITPAETFVSTWETSKKKNLKKAYRGMILATIDDKNQWHIKLDEGDSVYVYRDVYNKQNDHYLKIKLKHVSKHLKMKFVQKYWAGTSSREYVQSVHHPPKKTSILTSNGTKTYSSPCLINTDDVTKEQIGIHFTSNQDSQQCTIMSAIHDDKKLIMITLPLFCYYVTIIGRVKTSNP